MFTGHFQVLSSMNMEAGCNKASPLRNVVSMDDAMSLSSPRLREIINQNRTHELDFHDFSYTLMLTNTQQTLCINSLDIPRRTYSEQLDNAISLS